MSSRDSRKVPLRTELGEGLPPELAKQRRHRLCDHARKKTADAPTARALAAEGRTAHADADASTPFTLAHGIELEAFGGWTWQTRHEVSLQPGMPNVRRKGRPQVGEARLWTSP